MAVRAVTPGLLVSAHTSVETMSGFRFSALGSALVRVAAMVSPEPCWAASTGFSAAGMLLTMVPEFSAPPRRGLWQPSQVRRSPGRTWIQFRWVWMPRPLASTTASASGVSAGT